MLRGLGRARPGQGSPIKDAKGMGGSWLAPDSLRQSQGDGLLRSPFRDGAASLSHPWGAFEGIRGGTRPSPTRTWAPTETCLIVLMWANLEDSG